MHFVKLQLPDNSCHGSEGKKKNPLEKVIILDNAEQRLKQKDRGAPGFPEGEWALGQLITNYISPNKGCVKH